MYITHNAAANASLVQRISIYSPLFFSLRYTYTSKYISTYTMGYVYAMNAFGDDSKRCALRYYTLESRAEIPQFRVSQ